MSDGEQLSTLIGDIYDAALEPASWAETLPRISRFVGGPSAGLWSEDAATGCASVTCVSGFDDGYVDAYVSRYLALDPIPSAFPLARVGRPFTRSQVVCTGAFAQTRYYREWVRPQGLVDCMYVVLDRSGSAATMFAVSRRKHDGAIDDAMHRRMRCVVPHLRRAALIAGTIDRERSAAAGVIATLDRLSAAVLLIDASAHVVHVNAAGRDLLAAGAVLANACGRLQAGDPDGNGALQAALLAAGEAALDAMPACLPLTTRDGADYVVRVLPLTSGARARVGRTCAATAAVFVSKAEAAAPSQPELIARRYRLTPMELRVFLAIVEIGGVPDVAEVLGLSTETVKTHLGHVYEKTGVRRQADLVKVAMRFSSAGVG